MKTETRLAIVTLLLQLTAAAATLAAVPESEPIEEVLVTGQQPGPGLWRATLPSAGHDHDSGILSHVFRPRVLVYCTILLVVISAFLVTLANRVPLRVEVIRDRLTLSRTNDEGRLENIYTVQILNMENRSHRYKITASGADDIHVMVDDKLLQVGPQDTAQVPMRLEIDPINLKGPSPTVMIRVQSEDNPALVRETKSSFLRR